MKNLITCMVVCLLSCTALAELWTVDDDGKADFDNIQAAVDAANNGDRIIVMPGTYTSTADEVVDMRGKKIWLHSSAGAEVTIIDGEGTRRGIYCGNGENSNTIIEGFTIEHGSGCEGSGMNNLNSSPTVINCIFNNNLAYEGGGCMNNYGGGVKNENSNPTLTNCIFINNHTHGYGGGMYNKTNSNPLLTNCTFEGNSASFSGGGMYNRSSSPSLIACIFDGNFLTLTNTTTRGGGIYNFASDSSLTNCTFINNTSNHEGGGIYNYNSDATLTNCVFENNAATSNGGGIYNDNSSPSLSDCIITNNYASGGGGIWNWNTSNPTLTNNYVCGNLPDQIFGDYSDDGGNIIAETCPWNQGACCTNDNCLVSDQEDCNAFFGQWLGEGTTCESNPCPIHCAGDINVDGQIDVQDLLILIAAWGACP